MHFIDPVTVAGWPEPNYDHPETRGHGISAVNILLILAIVIFGARCFTRLRLSGGMGSDDFLLGAALVRTSILREKMHPQRPSDSYLTEHPRYLPLVFQLLS